jgi:hypothetical protein
MKRTDSWLWIAALSLLTGALLSSCGGDGRAGVGGVVIRERVAYLRVIDANTKAPLRTTVQFLTEQGELSFRRIVVGATDPNAEIDLNIARVLNPNARIGDFLLRNVPSNVRFRGIWIQIPAGYTAVIKHTDSSGNVRVIQLPVNPNTGRGCLIASEKAGVVDAVFSPDLNDLGTVEVYPNDPNTPPPPINEDCP